MRDIKFRVWIEVSTGGYWLNECSDPPLLDMEGNMLDECDGHCEHRDDMDGITIEQYTGLKDKNGVEIYEGDLVRWGDSKPQEIAWQGSGWNPFVDNMIDHYKSYRFEVIGNIHQNPELLGEQK